MSTRQPPPPSSNISTFISIQNMQSLLQIMTKFLEEKHGIRVDDLARQGVQLKKELFKHIQTIFQDPDAATVDVMRLNQMVLKKTKDVIMGVFQKTVLSREQEIYGDRPTMDSRLQSDYVLKDEVNHDDIDKEFERLAEVRRKEQSWESELKKMTLDSPAVMEEAIDENEFQHKYDRMLSERQLAYDPQDPNQDPNADADADPTIAQSSSKSLSSAVMGTKNANHRLFDDIKQKNNSTPEDPTEFVRRLRLDVPSHAQTTSYSLPPNYSAINTSRSGRVKPPTPTQASTSTLPTSRNGGGLSRSTKSSTKHKTTTMEGFVEDTLASVSATIDQPLDFTEGVDSNTVTDTNALNEEPNLYSTFVDDGITGAYAMTSENPLTSLDATNTIYGSDLITDRRDFINTTASTYKLENNYLIINSGDRSVETFPNKYYFRVRFDNANISEQQFEVYENNPTVPSFTKSSSRSKIQNVSGWTHPFTNVAYSSYNPDLPMGEVVGYEIVVLGVESGAFVERVMRNVHSVAFKRIMIPIEIEMANAFQAQFANAHHFNFNFPYVLLRVDEFSNLIGTNDTVRKSTCQFEYHDHFFCPNGRGYVTLKPVQNEVITFAPLIKAILPSLTLSLLKPNGELLSFNHDGNYVIKIETEISNPYYLKIILKQYFEKNAYYTGDYVSFKNYMLYNVSPDMDDVYVQQVMDYINREEGHEVKQVGEANEFGMFNSFYIAAPVKVDLEKGTRCLEDFMIDQIKKYNCVVSDFSIVVGNVLNMSLQTNISVTIITQSYDLDENLASTNV